MRIIAAAFVLLFVFAPKILLAANEAPTIDDPGAQTASEDVPFSIALTNIFVSTPGNATERASQTITSVSVAVTTGPAALVNSQDGLNTSTLKITNFNAAAGTATLSFTPAFPGTIDLSVTVVDSGPGTNPDVNTTVLVINFTVNGVNDAPVINQVPTQSGTSDVASTVNLSGIAPAPPNNADEAAQAGLLTANVTSGDPTYFSSLTVSAISGGNATITYVPAFARHGPVTISVDIDDHQALNNKTTIQFTLNLAPVNHAPVANDDSFSPVINKVFNVPVPGVLLNDTDPDGDTLTVTLIGPGTTNGVLTLNPNGSFTYQPNIGFSGTDSFQYQINDGQGTQNLSNIATATLTMGPNLAPIASNSTIAVTEDTPFSSTLQGSDPNFDALTFISLTAPSQGNIQITNVGTGAFTYTPNPDANGSDSFTFKVTDGQFDSNVATVTVNIAAVNDAPVADAQTVFVDQNVASVITLTGSDVDPDALTFSLTASPANGSIGSVSPVDSTSATVTYTPSANFLGADSLQFESKDATIFSAPAAVALSVIHIAPATLPNGGEGVAYNQSITISGGKAPATLLVGSILNTTGLTISGSGSATVTVGGTPTSSGTVSFTLAPSDLNGTGATRPYSLTVNAKPIFTSAPAANPSPAVVNTVVQFSTAVTPADASLSWNFGDGTPAASGANPTHTFATVGIFSVTVTATDIHTNTPASATFSLNVNGTPIVSNTPAFATAPSATPNPAIVNLAVQFSAAVTPADAALSWNFGDQSSAASGANTTHIYAALGVYTVVVTATDAHTSAVTRFSFSVTVGDAASLPGTTPPLAVKGTLTFKSRGDQVKLTGIIPLKSVQLIGGTVLAIDIGGLSRTVTFDKHGKGTDREVHIKGQTGKKFADQGPGLKFSVTAKGALKAQIAAGASLDASGNPVKLLLKAAYNGVPYSAVVPLTYKHEQAKFSFAP